MIRVHKLLIYSCLTLVSMTARPPEVRGQIQETYHAYWDSTREYTFTGLYLDSAGDTITYEKVILRSTGQRWSIDTQQTLLKYTLHPIFCDSARFPKIPLNGKPSARLTIFKEGAIQNDRTIWIHPVRVNQYILTELAPFPEIRLPVKKDSSWNSTLHIYEAFGTFKGTVASVYRITGEETRRYEFGDLKCWKIKAIGIHDRLELNSAEYFFNAEYGFTEMNYHFFNNQKIKFKLTGMTK